MPHAPRPLAPHELRFLALSACPELAAAFALADRVARLDPDALGIGPLVGEARAVVNGHSPRDALRVSHVELQDRLTFMLDEFGGALQSKYPGHYRAARDALESARRINP